MNTLDRLQQLFDETRGPLAESSEPRLLLMDTCAQIACEAVNLGNCGWSIEQKKHEKELLGHEIHVLEVNIYEVNANILKAKRHLDRLKETSRGSQIPLPVGMFPVSSLSGSKTAYDDALAGEIDAATSQMKSLELSACEIKHKLSSATHNLQIMNQELEKLIQASLKTDMRLSVLVTSLNKLPTSSQSENQKLKNEIELLKFEKLKEKDKLQSMAHQKEQLMKADILYLQRELDSHEYSKESLEKLNGENIMVIDELKRSLAEISGKHKDERVSHKRSVLRSYEQMIRLKKEFEDFSESVSTSLTQIHEELPDISKTLCRVILDRNDSWASSQSLLVDTQQQIAELISQKELLFAECSELSLLKANIESLQIANQKLHLELSNKDLHLITSENEVSALKAQLGVFENEFSGERKSSTATEHEYDVLEHATVLKQNKQLEETLRNIEDALKASRTKNCELEKEIFKMKLAKDYNRESRIPSQMINQSAQTTDTFNLFDDLDAARAHNLALELAILEMKDDFLKRQKEAEKNLQEQLEIANNRIFELDSKTLFLQEDLRKVSSCNLELETENLSIKEELQYLNRQNMSGEKMVESNIIQPPTNIGTVDVIAASLEATIQNIQETNYRIQSQPHQNTTNQNQPGELDKNAQSFLKWTYKHYLTTLFIM
ncbi:hypothetical protein BDR26DRAFT_915139, partial [Obelidium mucronatum]